MADLLTAELYRWHRKRPFRTRDAKGRLLMASAHNSLASARAEIARFGRNYMEGLMFARAQDEMEGRSNPAIPIDVLSDICDKHQIRSTGQTPTT